MKIFVLFLGIVVLLSFVFVGCGIIPSQNEGIRKDSVLHLKTKNGEYVFDVEIADSFSERREGLMRRSFLGEKAGMFFVFEVPKVENFWMKNTLIPLDIIYFDENYRVVHIVKNAQPCEEDKCPSFSSVYPVKYVLEINGGLSDRLGIDVGDFAYLDV